MASQAAGELEFEQHGQDETRRGMRFPNEIIDADRSRTEQRNYLAAKVFIVLWQGGVRQPAVRLLETPRLTQAPAHE